jgi:predicted RNase H-like HicB family nuclease
MKSTQQFTAIIEREGDGYISLCPELDIASQGDNIEAARQNLIEALELFFETADPSEVKDRLHRDLSTKPTQSEVADVLHSLYTQKSQEK